MPSLFRDDNAESISDPSALVPFFTAAQSFNGTTGAATAEIAGVGAACTGSSQSMTAKRVMVRIATGANDVYYAFGAAGASGSFTSASMAYIPQRWVEYVCIDPNIHKSFYHLQVSAAGNVQVTILGLE